MWGGTSLILSHGLSHEPPFQESSALLIIPQICFFLQKKMGRLDLLLRFSLKVSLLFPHVFYFPTVSKVSPRWVENSLPRKFLQTESLIASWASMASQSWWFKPWIERQGESNMIQDVLRNLYMGATPKTSMTKMLKTWYPQRCVKKHLWLRNLQMVVPPKHPKNDHF